ncbi:hypothetical protein MMC07_001039 [Pseudocyphellaria aurata]|nr:hypothetical protein [Pseudocyphellaria aurata]
MRCLQDLTLPSSKCLPCAKSNRECVFTEPSKTRRRKRTDTRVAELEKEVQAMSTAIKQGNVFSVHRNADDYIEHIDIDEEDKQVDKSHESLANRAERESAAAHGPFMTANSETAGFPRGNSTGAVRGETNGRKDLRESHVSGASGNASKPSPVSTDSRTSHVHGGTGDSIQSVQPFDVIDRGLLSMHEASRLYSRYTHEFVQYFPIVTLPKGYDAVDIRRTKPILFLAVIAAASGSSDAALNVSLNKEILQVYADQIVIEGKKSLELIQSILLTVAWYCPPDNFEELRFYQYIHMAATMALDLGIAKKSRVTPGYFHPSAIGSLESPGSESSQDERIRTNNLQIDGELLDSRRTILSCYLNCSSVSVSLHRPSMLRFTNYMAECIESLENSPNASLEDHRLVAWVQLQRIMEGCSTSFEFDDPSATVGLEEPHIQLMLKGFEKKLKGWRENLIPGVMNATLLMSYHVNNIYLHEMALYPDHNVEDFRPPFLVKTTTHVKDKNTSISPAYLDAIMICLSSTHALLKEFLQTSVEALRVVPIVTYVRMAYGVVVLTKLHFSAISPTSEIGKVLDHDSLQVSQYLNRLVIHLVAIVGAEKNRMASKFLMILIKLKAWYGQHKMRAHSTLNGDEQLEPCMHIKPQDTEPESVTASIQQRASLKRQKIFHGSNMEINGAGPPLENNNVYQQAKSNENIENNGEIFAINEVDLADMNPVRQMSDYGPLTHEAEYTLPHDDIQFSNSIDLSSDNLILFDGSNPFSENLDNWILNTGLFGDMESLPGLPDWV